MNGKTLKVIEYNLTFGATNRYINVFGFFKYKQNGNLYIVYTDVDTPHELIYYGSSHEKNNNILSMSCKEEEAEIIKEYIYKLINNESLDSFDIYTLDDITGIELVSSNKLEIKLEVIRKLEELTIPKKENKQEPSDEMNSQTKKKKKGGKIILILLMLIIIMGGGYFFLTTITNSEKISKTITCTKSYQHDKLKATIEENNTYSFTSNNELKVVNSISRYKFINSTEYENFINDGSVHKYTPESSKSYTPDDANLTIEYVAEITVDSSYTEPTEYETLINYYTNREYNCSEKIEE